MDNKNSSMMDALNQRRGRGLDVTIQLGQSPQAPQMQEEAMKKNDPKSDLAPPGPALGQMGDIEHSQSPMEMQAMSDHMLGGMSDHDKSDMMSRKPRSLMDRARMDAMKRSDKK